jgi:hypothetical protein
MVKLLREIIEGTEQLAPLGVTLDTLDALGLSGSTAYAAVDAQYDVVWSALDDAKAALRDQLNAEVF